MNRLPRFALDDVRNGCPAEPELISDVLDTNAFGVKTQDGGDIRCGYSRARIIGSLVSPIAWMSRAATHAVRMLPWTAVIAFRGSAVGNFVIHVVLKCPESKVCRVATRAVVTDEVPHLHTLRNCSERKHPGHAVRTGRLSVDAGLAVPTPAFWPLPFPAAIAAGIYACPEPGRGSVIAGWRAIEPEATPHIGRFLRELFAATATGAGDSRLCAHRDLLSRGASPRPVPTVRGHLRLNCTREEAA